MSQLIKELCSTETTTLTFNGRQLEVHISIRCYFNEDYDSSCDDEDTVRGLEAGEFTPVTCVVTASTANVEGSDSLGGILLVGPDSLEACIGPDCYDLRRNAVSDLRDRLAETLAAIQERVS